MSTSVLLADDHQILREGLVTLLKNAGFNVVAEVADGMAAVEGAGELRPDVAVLDIAMPRLNGLDAAREIVKVSPATKVILLSMHSEDHYVLEALQAGIKGYMLKNHSADDLENAIKRVVGGDVYLSPGLSDIVVQAYHKNHTSSGNLLTPRERQVLQLVAEGNSTKKIAALLELSTKTVDTHRTRLMQKLEIHDTVGLVHYAIRCGLIQV